MNDRIKLLCKKKGISIKKLEEDLGYSNGSILKSENLRSDRVGAIARYFEVSTDYLISGVDKNFPQFEPEHVELVSLYVKLNAEQKNTVMTFLRSLAPSDQWRLTKYVSIS